jgi:glucose-6-phosphate isomerase
MMDGREHWNRYRQWLYDNREIGLRLDVSLMDLPGDLPERIKELLDHAFDAMEALEGGAIANPDEGRMVGHYWLRAPELAPDPALKQAVEETVERVRRFATAVHQGGVASEAGGRFRHLLLIGIGGSALGPQFVAEALGGDRDLMSPSFLDNTDPDGIDRRLGELRGDLDRTLTLVISKSGGTPETRNGMLEAAAAYEAAGLDFGRHAVAVTGEGSRLDSYAREHRFIETFPMWDWVGGRTSELCAVGLLPAALQGIDIDELLAGAALMDRATRSRDARLNPSALLALSWFHAGEGRGKKDMVILPYKDRLRLLSRYLQQLVMESLGKANDLDGRQVNQGIVVYGNKGSTDQHAYVQQLREGPADFFATFIQVLRDREGAGIEVEEGATSGDFLHGFLLGTRRALYDNGRGSMTITLDAVTPGTIGALIALYERAVGLYASLININAYHQPGVEAGKKAAAAVLDLQRKLMAELERCGTEGGGCEQLAAAAGADEDIETVFQILERLSADPHRGLSRTEGPTPFDAVYRLV